MNAAVAELTPPAASERGRPRRAAVVAVVVVAMLSVLAACDVARAGQRCRGGFARDSTHVLVCKSGRWARGATIGQVAAAIVALRNAELARGATPSLAVETVASGLDHPWDVGFNADGVAFLTERSGNIDLAYFGVVRTLGRPPDVQPVGEGGMMGLAVDPGFASNRRIYTCMRSTAGGAPDVRVVRWVVDPSFTSLTARTDIVVGIPVAGFHVGCRVRFGPDGALWIGTGDAATGPNPQNPLSLGGKVLRVTTDGVAASGNPVIAGWDPRVHDIGHRNVQGLAFRPSDGAAFSVEHGPDVDDEVNKLLPGANYGWNPVPRTGGTAYDQTGPMTDTARVPGAVSATWASGAPTIAPSGATFLSGAQWKAWNGALVMAVLKGNQLRVLQLDGAGTGVTGQWTALTDRGRLRSAVQGPDGALYVTTDAANGSLLKVTPS